MLNFRFELDQLIIEYNNEILKALTNLALQYRIGFNFTDLYPAPGPSKINKRRNLHRMIELQAPLFLIKKMVLKKGMAEMD